MNDKPNNMDIETAARLLEVEITASPAEIRAAYLKKVQEHPPDREPELFEQIRDAHEQLSNPAARASAVLRGPDPGAPLTDLLRGLSRTRVFVGSQLWIQLLKEKRA